MKFLIRLIIVLIPIVLLIAVGLRYLDMDGVYKISWEAGESSPFVHGFRPAARVGSIQEDIDGAKYYELTGDPVYLSVTPPGNYESIDVDVWLDANDQPLVEFGATVNADAGQIDLKPMTNSVIDDLDWMEVSEGDLHLLQRSKDYESIDALLNDPPPLAQIATYNYDLPEDENMPRAWTGGPGARMANASLRGFHEYTTVTDGRGLSISAEYMDMNRNPGADPVAIRVWQDGDLVAEVEAEDDGVERDTNVSLGRETISLDAPGLQEGLVKVELNAGNDVYWRRVEQNLPKMTFTKNVFVGDEVGYLDEPREVVLYTDAQHMTFFTRHAEGVQTISVGDQKLEIAIPHEHYNIENSNTGVTRVVIPKGDMLVVTDGRVSFSRNAFFNPFPVQLDDRTNLDKLGVNYVIAKYSEPEKRGRWSVGEALFWLPALERESDTVYGEVLTDGSYRFVVSLPHVEEREASIDIHRIDMTFKREARTVGDILSRVWQKLVE